MWKGMVKKGVTMEIISNREDQINWNKARRMRYSK